MRVSVIIPTLNEEKYLGQCLDSISKQDMNSFEVIIGDGGSTDKTRKIAQDYGAKFVVEPKRTIAAGRQKACGLAKGEIIVSTDADIIATPGWLSKLSSAIGDEVVCSHGNVVPYDGSRVEGWAGKKLMPWWFKTLTVLGKACPAGSNLCFSKKTFDEVGGFNTELVTGEDLELVRRLKTQGKVVFADNADVYVSMRRVQGWGKLKFFSYHLSNAVRVHTTGVGHSGYEPVR
jgi:glycosyltransferase involved in cell wall biosynthesis